MPTMEEQFTALKGELTAISTTMADWMQRKDAAEAAGGDGKIETAEIVKQIKAQLKAEDKIDELAKTADLAELAKSVDLDAVKRRVKGLERAGGRRLIGKNRRRSVAADWAEKIAGSALVKNFIDTKENNKGRLVLDRPTQGLKSYGPPRVKAVPDPMDTDDVDPEETIDEEWVLDPLPMSALRSLIPSRSIDKETYKFVRQNLTFQIYTEVDTTVVVPAATPTAVDVDNAQGFKVGAVIYKDDAQTDFGTITAVDRTTAQNTITINSAAGFTATEDERLWSIEFIWTTEAATIPYGKVTFEQVTETARKIAVVHAITEEAIEDNPELEMQIENIVIPDIMFREARQFYYGTGSNGEMLGFLNNTDIAQYLWSSGTSGDTKLDAIWRARGVARLAHVRVDGVTISVADNTDLATLKGDDGHYLARVTIDADGNAQAQGMRFVEDDALDAGDFLVGGFAAAAVIVDRTAIELRISDSHADFFVDDLIAMKFRMRSTLAVRQPKAFVRGSFDSAPVEA